MQPRLIAISYPSLANDGATSPKKANKSSSNDHAQHSRSSRIVEKLRRPSWQEVKSALRIFPRKQSTQREENSSDVLGSWYERSISGRSVKGSQRQRASKFIDRRKVSKWESLPRSVKERILQHLESSYDHFYNARTQQHWRNDLMSVQLSCNTWVEPAQKHLYESIRLKPRHDQYWYNPHADDCRLRITQLRNALRTNSRLAALVKHLVLLPEKHHDERQNVYFSDVVASVVMACPNLETLSTHHSPYTHSFDKLFHALSTRSKLKHHTWLVGEDPFVQSRSGRHYRSGMLSNQQTQLFLQHHVNWQNLESMNLVSQNGRGILEHSLLVKTLNMLPSLKHLHISSFDSNDFSDDTLSSLPPVEHLTLKRCHGISETGLCLWAQSPAAVNIKKLVLESQHITSLLTISGVLESLPKIEAFRMLQLEFEPGLPLELEIEEPLFTSDTLKMLEWYTATGNYCDSAMLRSKLPEHLKAQAQTWPRSKSSLHILSSVLDFAFPHLQKLILPGYGNLDGLLRWVRHTSWQTSDNITTALSAPRRVVSAPASPRLPVSTQRNTVRFSLRPASPSFYEYDHWRKTPLSYSPLPAVSEFPGAFHSEEEEGSASPPMSIPCTNSATVSPTHSDFRSSDDGSTLSSASSPSLGPQEISRFSTDTMDEEDHDKSHGHYESDIDHSTSRGSTQHSDHTRRGENHHNSHSRHSSISVLLDGYARGDTKDQRFLPLA